jgi:predicted O-methyltransferase YrrM
LVRKPLCITEDKAGSALFWVNRSARSMRHGDFENCRSSDEYFEFSTEMFGPHQIKNEILSFLEFAKTEQPEIVCEIGTADGGTNFLLSQALPSVSLMLGVDLYVKRKFQLRYFSRKSQRLCFIDGSSYVPRTIRKVKSALGDRKLDLLFVDGDHNYDGVKQDFLNYRYLVRDGGIIAFHDIIPDHFSRYGIRTNRWVGGVPRLWNTIKSLYPSYEFIENSEQDGLGIGAIRYSGLISVPHDL